MKKNFIRIVIAFLIVSSFGSLQLGDKKVQAAEDYTYSEISQMLTEEAIKMDIPPEVAKAIALIESDWDQQKVSGAQAIGIMQVLKPGASEAYKTKLKEDTRFNIQEGLKILDEKFKGKDGKLPTINDNDRELLESWYFAVLAYSGAFQVNSPIYLSKNSTERNLDAYQEKVYKAMMIYNLISSDENYKPIPFKFELDDFRYEGKYLRFETFHYELPEEELHRTAQKYENQDIVITAPGAEFRTAPYKKANSIKTASGREPITLISNQITDGSNAGQPMIYKHFVWYKTQLENGKEAYIASGDLIQLGQRLSGPDRYKTAAAIAQEGWPNGADTVVIARGGDYPDALAGTPLAYQLDAPMLLTQDNKLTESTKAELERLNPNKVIILGSAGAITNDVKREIEGMGIEVDRHGGADRFETAALIANQLPKSNTAILAYGKNFPDALSIAPYAAKNGYPIYLALTDTLPEATAKAIKNYDNVIVVGSNGVISEKALTGVSNYKRYAGKDRYETNADILKNLPLGSKQAYVATGKSFPDALTGAVLAAKSDAPLILSTPKSLQPVTQSYLENSSFHHFGLLGGDDVINVEKDLTQILLNN
ncbi:cell wall-binding repeat-containing protein [Guptibacillus algicola]|uniref:cell wall-binding repeat-containing protein n=1 Tax=Guptibacillus algicola TaxID=225844 RepID=UPI001CD218C0|nr:cell wall-binding repeat-containing protein [Alkalihalobacillus algicola]MCA0987099.1 cell wall-binding repeat-containing protein [Alkalihalobacillus algicola]